MIIFENKKLVDRLGSPKQLKDRIRIGFSHGLYETKRDYIKTITTGTRSGRPYRIKYRGRILIGFHSSPIEPIGNITGRTAKGAYTQVSDTSGTLGSKAPYSGDSEYGTSKIKPRKTATNVVNKNLTQIAVKIENSILK